MTTTAREDALRKLAEALVRQPRASMEQLAQALGVSRATLHRLVSSRDELIKDISTLAVDACTGCFASVQLEEGPADEVLRRLIEALTPNAGLYLFLRRQRADLAATLEDDWQCERDRLTRFFQRGQEHGAFRVDVSAQWLVDALGALLNAAAEAAYEGRLAPADMNHVVCSVLLDGARRSPE